MRRWLAIIALSLTPALASAECGWLLMLPPLANTSTYTDPEAPIVQWQQSGAFDTAKECETALQRKHAYYSDHYRSLEKKDDDFALLIRKTLVRYVEARCLPASQVPIR